MAVTLLSEEEAIPAQYPDLAMPDLERFGWTSDNAAAVWKRIEAYCKTRWTSRDVTWIFSGCVGDELSLPLGPVNSITSELWQNEAWIAQDLAPSPLGYQIPCDGTYRLTANVGGGDVPADAMSAAKRLAGYLVDIAPGLDPHTGLPVGRTPWANQINVAHSGEHAGSYSIQRQNNWLARALQASGAADLLRPYRRNK